MRSKYELKQRIEKILYECDMHTKRLSRAITKMSPVMPLDSDRYLQLTEDEIEHIDQFLFRFAKLQDAMGAKLFRYIMLYLGEDIENRPFIDILNRMEKIGLIDSANEWRELREDRNELSHNYENEPISMSISINILYEKSERLIEIYNRIKSYYLSKSNQISNE